MSAEGEGRPQASKQVPQTLQLLPNSKSPLQPPSSGPLVHVCADFERWNAPEGRHSPSIRSSSSFAWGSVVLSAIAGSHAKLPWQANRNMSWNSFFF